jgi:vesicle coat complex subunit
MLNEKADQTLFDKCIQAIKVDLTCGNEVCEALALATIGNIGSAELAGQLGEIVTAKAFDERKGTPVYVRKRACLTLLSFFRRNRNVFN